MKIDHGHCWSCCKIWKTREARRGSFCYGCRHHVCLTCVKRYGHTGYGAAHGREKKVSARYKRVKKIKKIKGARPHKLIHITSSEEFQRIVDNSHPDWVAKALGAEKCTKIPERFRQAASHPLLRGMRRRKVAKT